MTDSDDPYMLIKVLKEKGFDDEQVVLIIEALEDDRVCSLCGGVVPCYCSSVYDE